MSVDVRVVDRYDDPTFNDLVRRNLETDRVFVPALDDPSPGDPSFRREARSIRIGAFDGDRLIGLSWGEAVSRTRFMTHMSLVEPAYRGHGVYSRMLELLLEETRAFAEVDSYHHVFNNRIIATKLKRGFYVVGFDQSIMIGPRLLLRYFHDPRLLELMRFRMGEIADPRGDR